MTSRRCGVLVHDQREERGARAGHAEAARPRAVPDGLDDSTPLPHRDGPRWPGQAERGWAVVTDAWQPYRKAVGQDFEHIPHPISSSGFQAHELLPAVHRVAALLKGWLLGTHQGSMTGGHLPAYLDEFTFGFNRRRASHRGLVFYRLLQPAVGAPPVTYRELVLNSRPKKVRPAGVLGPPDRPRTLALPPADKPWRHTQSLD